MPHVIDTLHHDHEKVSELIEKLMDTTSGAEKTRASLCEQIKQELEAHTEFEEKVFYPAVGRKNKEAKQEVDTAMDEHEEVDEMLDRLADMDPLSEEFMDTASRIKQSVQAHVKHEEEKIFPLAKKALDADDAEQMSKRHDEMLEAHQR